MWPPAPPQPRAPARLRDKEHDAKWTKKREVKKAQDKAERARKAARKAMERNGIRAAAEQVANREVLRAGWADAPPVLNVSILEYLDEAILAPPPYHGNSRREDKEQIKEVATAHGGRVGFDRDSMTWFVDDRRTMLALTQTGLWSPVALDASSPHLDAAGSYFVRQLVRLLAPRHDALPSSSAAGTPIPARARSSDVPADEEEDFERLERLGVPRAAAALLAELPPAVLGPHAGISPTGRVVRALCVGPLVPSQVEEHYARHVDGAIGVDEFRRRVCGVRA